MTHTKKSCALQIPTVHILYEGEVPILCKHVVNTCLEEAGQLWLPDTDV